MVVSIMMSEDWLSQVMYQKSVHVEARGPWVAIYLKRNEKKIVVEEDNLVLNIVLCPNISNFNSFKGRKSTCWQYQIQEWSWQRG